MAKMPRISGKIETRAISTLPPVGVIDGWTPDTSLLTLLLWYEARQESFSDSDPVTLMTDLSGNTFDLEEYGQDGGDDSAIYHAGGGYPYVQMSAESTGDTYLKNPDFDSVTTGPFTMIVVGDQSYSNLLAGIGYEDCDHNVMAGFDHAAIWCDDITHPHMRGDVPTIAMYVYDGTDFTIYEGWDAGAFLKASGARTLDIHANAQVGALSYGGGHFHDAKFYSMMVFDGAMSEAELNAAALYCAGMLYDATWTPATPSTTLLGWWEVDLEDAGSLAGSPPQIPDHSGNDYHFLLQGSGVEPTFESPAGYPRILSENYGDQRYYKCRFLPQC